MITDSRETDNRTHEDLEAYYVARIEALVRRVHELEKKLAEQEQSCQTLQR